MPTLHGVTTPEGVSQPVVHEHLAALAQQLLLRDAMVFATDAERTAFFGSLGTSPSLYATSILLAPAPGQIDMWTGTAWAPVIAPTLQSATTDLPTTTSLTYVSIGNQTGHAFVASVTGKVMIWWSSNLEASATNNISFVAPEVREGTTVGSGAAVLTASDDIAIMGEWDAAARTSRWGASHMLSGLTPGASYNVRLLCKTTGGTGQFGRRTVITQPVF